MFLDCQDVSLQNNFFLLFPCLFIDQHVMFFATRYTGVQTWNMVLFWDRFMCMHLWSKIIYYPKSQRFDMFYKLIIFSFSNLKKFLVQSHGLFRFSSFYLNVYASDLYEQIQCDSQKSLTVFGLFPEGKPTASCIFPFFP